MNTTDPNLQDFPSVPGSSPRVETQTEIECLKMPHGGDYSQRSCYTPYKTEFRGWMLKTPTGKIDYIWSEEAAKKIATISKADDLEEARTGTSMIAKVLRKHFEREGEL